MIILGIDPSFTNYAYSLYDTSIEDCILSGKFSSPSHLPIYRRTKLLQDYLRSFLLMHPEIDFIGMESAVFGSSYSEGLYALFCYSMEVFSEVKTPLVLFSPSQVKAKAREFLDLPSSFKMEKRDMQEAAKRRSSFQKYWGDDEADAFWVSHLAATFWRLQQGEIPESSLTSKEFEMLAHKAYYKRGAKKGQLNKTNLGILHKRVTRFLLREDF
jgi:hypothetical protein